MDEDYEPKERPRPKEPRRTTPWSPALLRLVRVYVLKTHQDDFVLQWNVSKAVGAPSHDVGRCLNALVREGILMPRCPIAPVDRDGDKVSPSFHGINSYRTDVVWDGTAWVVRSESYTRSRKTGRIRYSTKVVKDTPCTWWDGSGYYVIRDSDEFREACREEGLPEDPIKDPWTCKNERCRTENEGPSNRTNCKKCFGARFPKNEKGEKDERPKVLCPRCGSVIPYKSLHGKRRVDHPLRRCNFELVKYVLEV